MDGISLLAAVGGGGVLVYFGWAWLKQATVALFAFLVGLIVAKFLKPLGAAAVVIAAIVAAHWGLTRGAGWSDFWAGTLILLVFLAVLGIIAWRLSERSDKNIHQ